MLVFFPLQVREGIDYLSNRELLQSTVEEWRTSGYVNYCVGAEKTLALALSGSGHNQPRQMGSLVTPIILNSDQRSTASVSRFDLAATAQGSIQSDSNANLAGEVVDLEGLMRIPWNIEVKLTNSPSATTPNSTEYLRIDAFLGAFQILL